MQKIKNDCILVALFIACSMLFYYSSLGAQDLNKILPISLEVAKLIQAVPTENYQSSGAVILLKEVKITVKDGGLCTVSLHVVGKILDSKAAVDYGTITVPFNSYYDDAQLIIARTIKENGSTHAVSPDAIQIKTLPTREQYSDMRYLSFSLPSLDKGSFFEFEASITDKLAIIDNQWFHGGSFNYLQSSLPLRVDPVYLARVVLDIPEGQYVNYALRHLEISPVILKKGGRSTYTWEKKNVPAISMEPDMPPPSIMVPTISISSMKSWTQVGEWTNKTFLPQTRVTSDIAEKAKEVVKTAKTRREKIEALFYWLEENVRYIGADIDRGGYKPHFADEVLKSRYGDCKDQAILLVSMLKAVDIEAHPALIDVGQGYGVDERVPSLMFRHMITYVPDNKEPMWLDTTTGFAQFPHLQHSNHDKWAFVVDSGNGKLLKTPGLRPQDNHGTMYVTYSMKGETLERLLVIEATGDFSELLKTLFRLLSPDQQKYVMSEASKGSFVESCRLISFEKGDLDTPRLPFRVTARFECESGKKPDMTSYYYKTSPMPVISFFTSLSSLAEPESKKHDYHSNYPFTLSLDVLYTALASGMRPVTVPPAQQIDGSAFFFKSSHTKQVDSVRSQYSLIMKKNLIDKKTYASFYSQMQNVLNTSEGLVTFSSRSGAIMGVESEEAAKKDPVNVQNLIVLARQYLTRGKYQEAREVLEKALQGEPNYGELYYLLGLTLGYLDLYDQSKVALQKARSLGYKP
jgi:hypothetical protein